MSVLPIIHSTVDAPALEPEIAARYALPKAPHVELLARGMNDVYVVLAGPERYAARLWRAGRRTGKEVSYELDYLDFLLKEGISVIPAIAGKDGEKYFTVTAPDGARQVALFTWAEGEGFNVNPTAAIADQIGGLMGKLHVVSRRFARARERPLNVTKRIRDRMPAIMRLASYREDYQQMFRTIGEALVKRLDSLTDPELMGATHGDSTPSNFFIKDGVVTMLDFETCGYGFLSHELASFYWSSDKNKLPPEISQSYNAAYDRARPRSKEEMDLFPLFVCNKVFDFLSGYAFSVNALGPGAFRYPGLDWMAKSVHQRATEAKLI